MKTHEYSKAILRMLDAGTSVDEALKKLEMFLERKGEARLFPNVLMQLKTTIEHRTEKNRPRVRLHNTKDEGMYQKQITEVLTSLEATHAYVLEEDPSLIGGFVVTANHTQLDASYKKKLLDLYRTIITT